MGDKKDEVLAEEVNQIRYIVVVVEFSVEQKGTIRKGGGERFLDNVNGRYRNN